MSIGTSFDDPVQRSHPCCPRRYCTRVAFLTLKINEARDRAETWLVLQVQVTRTSIRSESLELLLSDA